MIAISSTFGPVAQVKSHNRCLRTRSRCRSQTKRGAKKRLCIATALRPSPPHLPTGSNPSPYDRCRKKPARMHNVCVGEGSKSAPGGFEKALLFTSGWERLCQPRWFHKFKGIEAGRPPCGQSRGFAGQARHNRSPPCRCLITTTYKIRQDL